jgi:hypothetical protein
VVSSDRLDPVALVWSPSCLTFVSISSAIILVSFLYFHYSKSSVLVPFCEAIQWKCGNEITVVSALCVAVPVPVSDTSEVTFDGLYPVATTLVLLV